MRVRGERSAAVIAEGGEVEGEEREMKQQLLLGVLRCRDVALKHRMRILTKVCSLVSACVYTMCVHL